MASRSLNGRNLYFEWFLVFALVMVLTSASMPLYKRTIVHTGGQVCQSNQKLIANAVQAARASRKANSFEFSYGEVTPVKLPDLQRTPNCPDSGVYRIVPDSSLGHDRYRVECSILAHGRFAPDQYRAFEGVVESVKTSQSKDELR